jgi:hypothetical protein
LPPKKVEEFFSFKTKQKAEQGAKYIAIELKNFSNEIAVLGPATPDISRINDQYL